MNKYNCLYYNENSARKCTHPNQNRTCCSGKNENPKLEKYDLELVKAFVADNPEFNISDFEVEDDMGICPLCGSSHEEILKDLNTIANVFGEMALTEQEQAFRKNPWVQRGKCSSCME